MSESTQTTAQDRSAKKESKSTQYAKISTAVEEKSTVIEPEKTDPTQIKYKNVKNVGQQQLENGSTKITYRLTEPEDEVPSEYKTQTHVVILKGKKRTIYEMYSGDTVEPEKYLGSLDVSATG